MKNTRKRIIDARDLTEEQQNEFIDGWEAAGGYIGDETWCRAWEWGAEIVVRGEDYARAGAEYWKAIKEEVYIALLGKTTKLLEKLQKEVPEKLQPEVIKAHETIRMILMYKF